MNVRDIAISRPRERRRVGIRYETHIHVMRDAICIDRDLDIACDVDELTISLEVPRIAAAFYLGALERYTGIPGFNDWDR